MWRRFSLPYAVLLFVQIRCQQNQKQTFSGTVAGPGTLDQQQICTEKNAKFLNLTQQSLQSFCEVNSVTDMLQFQSGQVDACCRLDQGIINNNCFDPCQLQNNAFAPINILIDLWRAICRFEQRQCSEVTISPARTSPTEGGGGGADGQNQLVVSSPPIPAPIAVAKSPDNTLQAGLIPLIPLLEQVPGFSLLLSYLNKADIFSLLGPRNQPFTIFAPSNSAFQKFAVQFGVQSTILDEVIPKWTEILQYHLVQGIQRLDDIQKDELLLTYQGQMLVVRSSKEAGVGLIQSCCVIESMAEVLAQDYVIKEGILHAIDTILVPHHINL
eukprot:TRINITY_DN57259_c0_g1_i1.p1 TRINITY_DN57259_c0_g1~~TRINITY_DN57259_c0_g1_i1.p1  ORF type:complete len:327 (+),score=46.45 TRINITY_DN57259_c0_g1_i1:54-1034(+)